MSRLYSAMLSLDGKLAVVVGAGAVATRKVGRLLETGAQVRLIATEATAELRQRARDGLLTWEQRPYRPGDLERAWLAFAATNHRTVNAAVADEARERGIPVNVADDPNASTFQVPAVVERGDLQVAVSTGGRSPAFARNLRIELEAILSPERLQLLELFAELRADLQRRDRSGNSGWNSTSDRLLALLQQGQTDEARRLLRAEILAGQGA